MNLFYQPLIPEGAHYLDEDESRHCIKVLRNRRGNEILVTDGNGSMYRCVIEKESPMRCEFSIVERLQEHPKDFYIHIAIAPTKNADRIEWFVEKATELGIDRITLLSTEHSERTFIKKERLDKVAISAMKQSLKTRRPEIRSLTALTDLQGTADEDQKFIAYVDDSNPLHLKDVASPSNRYLVLIGPEGDFSRDELDAAMANKFVKVSLGKSRLRTETAGLAACHILNLANS